MGDGTLGAGGSSGESATSGCRLDGGSDDPPQRPKIQRGVCGLKQVHKLAPRHRGDITPQEGQRKFET